MSTVNLHELEETLTRLESIDAVRVVGAGDDIKEIHVLAAQARSPKQVVRDVQSLAMARFGVNIDRRVVSVVQIAPEVIRQNTSERPGFAGITESTDGSRVTVTVGLRFHDEDFTGTATGPGVSSAKQRLVGEATLQAVADLLDDDAPPLALDAVGTAPVGMRMVTIAVIVGARGLEEEISVGSALTDDDDNEATVRAVLDALNRRLAGFRR